MEHLLGPSPATSKVQLFIKNINKSIEILGLKVLIAKSER